METDDVPCTADLIWEFASAGVYVALDGRFKISRRRFAQLPGWYLIDNERRSEMRLDTLQLAQCRAYWVHNQPRLRDPSVEDMLPSLCVRSTPTYGHYEGVAGLVVFKPAIATEYYSFMNGIVAYCHLKTQFNVKVYFDDSSFEITSRAINKDQLKANLLKCGATGLFELFAVAVRSGP